YYDIVKKQPGVKWKMTMGLFWIRPFSFLNLDEVNRQYILHKEDYYASVSEISDLKKLPSAKMYIEILEYFYNCFKKEECPHHSFLEISHGAWLVSQAESNEEDGNEARVSKASFLKWFTPVIDALKSLGGSGTP